MIRTSSSRRRRGGGDSYYCYNSSRWILLLLFVWFCVADRYSMTSIMTTMAYPIVSTKTSSSSSSWSVTSSHPPPSIALVCGSPCRHRRCVGVAARPSLFSIIQMPCYHSVSTATFLSSWDDNMVVDDDEINIFRTNVHSRKVIDNDRFTGSSIPTRWVSFTPSRLTDDDSDNDQKNSTAVTVLLWGTTNDDNHVEESMMTGKISWMMNGTDIISQFFQSQLQQQQPSYHRLPPFFVEDWNVLFYDLFLLINLVVSISFWVVHRWDISYIGIAFNEGCLLSLLWILAGLYNGSFLYSAIDGHQRPTSSNNSILSMKITSNNVENNQIQNSTTSNDSNNIQGSKHQNNNNNNSGGGPVAAGLLALHTYINTMNLRLLYALVVALLEHRSALSTASELLIPLEFGYGLVLMILWRALHSSYVLR